MFHALAVMTASVGLSLTSTACIPDAGDLSLDDRPRRDALWAWVDGYRAWDWLAHGRQGKLYAEEGLLLDRLRLGLDVDEGAVLVIERRPQGEGPAIDVFERTDSPSQSWQRARFAADDDALMGEPSDSAGEAGPYEPVNPNPGCYGCHPRQPAPQGPGPRSRPPA